MNQNISRKIRSPLCFVILFLLSSLSYGFELHFDSNYSGDIEKLRTQLKGTVFGKNIYDKLAEVEVYSFQEHTPPLLVGIGGDFYLNRLADAAKTRIIYLIGDADYPPKSKAGNKAPAAQAGNHGKNRRLGALDMASKIGAQVSYRDELGEVRFSKIDVLSPFKLIYDKRGLADDEAGHGRGTLEMHRLAILIAESIRFHTVKGLVNKILNPPESEESKGGSPTSNTSSRQTSETSSPTPGSETSESLDSGAIESGELEESDEGAPEFYLNHHFKLSQYNCNFLESRVKKEGAPLSYLELIRSWSDFTKPSNECNDSHLIVAVPKPNLEKKKAGKNQL